jgi:outer membrane protein OmpA-like peptidoglycan-associated protein
MTSRSNASLHGAIGLAAAIALTIVFAACASTPPPQLASARRAYEAAAADTDVNKYASVQLYEAKKELDRAADTWADTGDADETAHVAVLSEKRSEIATTVAAGARARQETKEILESRRKIELESRDQQIAVRDEEIATLKAKPTDEGMVLTLGGDVLFNTGSATMSTGANTQLNRIAQYLKEHSEREIVVTGHTDSTGSMQTNQSLSEQRAAAVGSYLVAQGVGASRIATRGLGPSMPIAGNETAPGRQQNRRVEITVLNPGEKASEHVLARP